MNIHFVSCWHYNVFTSYITKMSRKSHFILVWLAIDKHNSWKRLIRECMYFEPFHMKLADNDNITGISLSSKPGRCQRRWKIWNRIFRRHFKGHFTRVHDFINVYKRIYAQVEKEFLIYATFVDGAKQNLGLIVHNTLTIVN